ncbi:MAG: 16S rRNA (cytosine(1402)-N(4))-methyltransferase RsmH [Candidatus Harrisonbacteria bacterium]|nr:16S rRNA (cytosine(1402)-N(4))-methyltransferase RsmH [Candidatus Harrisonbacteria bacterium]
MTAHVSVLLKEVIELLDPKRGEIMIDGTAGGGGHARELAKIAGPEGRLLIVDWDKKAVEKLKDEFKNQKNLLIVHGNYADLPEIMEKYDFFKSDGLLLDLGFSSDQLEGSGQGFSFRSDEPLIMTYDEKMQPLSDFLKKASIEELAEIINIYGEERYAKKIAEAIFRNKHQISTSRQLAEIIRQATPKSYEYGRIHPATRTFQAFRIYLNKELENLEKVLGSLEKILKIGGRVVVISFHSLEDRIVKNSFRKLAKAGRLKILTKKPITASLEEIKKNPRSRSAKLRAAIIF